MEKVIQTLVEGYKLTQTVGQDSLRSDKHGKCCICGQDYLGYGNNPWPLKDEGECCDKCNWFQVIPARLGINIAEDEINSLKA